MKLPLPQLEQHLAKSLSPIYLVSGDETLLVQEAADLIRRTARDKGYTERVRVSAEANPDWTEHLHASAHSLSLFATQQIVELDLRGAKLNKTHSEQLQHYANKPADGTLLLITQHKLDSKSEQSAWFKAIDKAGVTIPIWPVPPEQLPQWVLQRAKKNKLNLSKQQADQLAQQVEGNLLAAAQEIEKLSLLHCDGAPLPEGDLTSDHAHFDIFQLVDSLLLGNSQRALRILSTLSAEDIEPTLIVWAITRELRTMAELHQQTKQGATLSALFPKYRIWEKRQPAVRAFLKRHSHTACCDFLVSAAQIDRLIKGAETGNVWDALQQLSLTMTKSI